MRTALVVLIALALPRLAVAQMSDTGLAERVAEVVTRHPALGIFDDVTVEATNGAVRLTGRVTTRVKRDAVAERAAKIDGVRSVANEIQVLPNSPLDARLRARVAQTIYGHPSFWRYASMANPPIHIIVENGHVTLTGCVNGDGEKTLAFALAQVEGAVGVKNELRGKCDVNRREVRGEWRGKFGAVHSVLQAPFHRTSCSFYNSTIVAIPAPMRRSWRTALLSIVPRCSVGIRSAIAT